MGAMPHISEPILLPPKYASTYACPNDVPVPLRHALKTAYDSGLTIKNIALVYELPEDWLTLLVKPPEGCA